jgi:hypothetical protein
MQLQHCARARHEATAFMARARLNCKARVTMKGGWLAQLTRIVDSACIYGTHIFLAKVLCVHKCSLACLNSR